MSPKIGQPGQFVNGTGGVKAARITSVNGDGTVNVKYDQSNTSEASADSKPFVDVGGTPPASGGYFQAVDFAA